MDNNSVSKFIDKIVLNFEDNYVIKNILSKLSDMYKSSNITIDDNNAIRVLPIEKFTASQKLKGESNKFVSSN